mmetsp:Transcript_21567/g.52540  ORF Transcript_21567/g.52540 Transcript_21567/m.52540 type:complete len:554 (+) Transcript_21567:2-1663(+)
MDFVSVLHGGTCVPQGRLVVMAFTTRSAKMAELQAAMVSTLGPGQYLAHEDRPVSPSFAPFGSTANRRAQEKQVAPPVGTYDPKVGIGTATESWLPRKEVAFKSSENRFLDKVGPNPGPGTYNVARPVQAGRAEARTMGAPASNGPPALRVVSAPSIPVQSQAYGYEETAERMLVRQPAPAFYPGTPKDSVGPDRYDVRGDAVAKAAPAPSFGRAERSMHRSTSTPGPGAYTHGRRRPKWTKISANFASRTERGAGTTVPSKDQASAPGPGSYTDELISRPESVPAKLQCFGTTVDRFSRRGSIAPGPGMYRIDRRLGRRTTGFQAGTGRETAFGRYVRESGDPGPGQYDSSNQTGLEGNTTHLGRSFSLPAAKGNGAFGGKDNRFRSSEESSKVAVGTYDVDEMQLRRAKLSDKASCTFVSKTGKKWGPNPPDAPPPGAYELVDTKQAAAVTRAPPKTEGFGVQDKRFKRPKTAPEVPGPGTYESGIASPPTLNRAMRGEARGQHEILAFAASEQRPWNSTRAPPATPGPGAYSCDPSWGSKTFNSLFGADV